MGECALAITSFAAAQIKHLRLLTFGDAMERITDTVPVYLVHLIYT